MRNLTWTEVTYPGGRTTWACEIGKYRLEVAATGHDSQPFYGKMTRDYGSGPVLILSGHYKSERTAKTGLAKRADNYGM